jgi:hypothetical protein
MNSFIQVVPETDVQNFLFGYRACKLEEIEDEPAEGIRGLDQAAPDYVYPFLPLVNGLGVCDTHCFQVNIQGTFREHNAYSENIQGTRHTFPFLPLVNGLAVCDTHCFQADIQ